MTGPPSRPSIGHASGFDPPSPTHRRPRPAPRPRVGAVSRLGLFLAILVSALLGGGSLPRAVHAAPTLALPVSESVAIVKPPVAGVAHASPPAQSTPEARPPAGPSTGGRYVVQTGDTLIAIARRHNVGVDALAAANGLSDADVIREGQVLVIPAPVAAAAIEAPERVPVAARPSPPPVFTPTSLVSTDAPGIQATPTATPVITITKKRIAQLVWPIVVKAPLIALSQPFQPGHSGIDIAAPMGTPVKAAAGGTVKVAEKSDSHYGWRIVIDQGDGVTTWYAHLSELKAKEGQTVKAGELIGAVGTTGLATGPHLHFELRVNNTPIDPRLALP